MTNPVPHKHTPVMTPMGQMCTNCQSILIQPIIDFDDARIECVKPKWLVRLNDSVADLQEQQARFSRAGQKLMPIDHILIHLSDALGVQWPDYIDQLGNEYRGNPPHEAKRYDEMLEDYQNTLGEF